MSHKCWRRILLLAALCLCAVLNIAARPYLPVHEGEIIVSGIVFHDANGNQRKDASERGLSNISVISQAPDAQGGAVNASTTTAADGSFTIQTHIGDRISVVPGAGYKALASSGIIVRAGMPVLVFPLYVDKVVVDRVIRMEPAAVTVPAPQVYVSPLITVPAPVVNVQPVDVRIAPAEVVVQPAPVHIAPVMESGTLWAAVAAISLSAVFGAAVIGSAIRAHTRMLRDVAVFEASCSDCQTKVNAANWKSLAEQVIADATGMAVIIEALISISNQPVPTMRFRATNSRVFIFSLGSKLDESKHHLVQTQQMASMDHLAAALELQKLWCFFAVSMRLPSKLPRVSQWHVAIVSSSVDHGSQQSSYEQVDYLNAEQPSSLVQVNRAEGLPICDLQTTRAEVCESMFDDQLHKTLRPQ